MIEIHDLDIEIYIKEYHLCFQKHSVVHKEDNELNQCVEFITK